MKTNTKKFAIGTILAAISGFVAGILTAPKSGKETRQDIKNAAVESVSTAEKELQKLHAQLDSSIDQAMKNLNKAKGRAKEQLDSAIEKADRAKAKAGQILDTVHKSNSPDSDLQKAISEASDAVKHLKTFLKKP